MDIALKFDVVIWSLIILGLITELIILVIPFLRRHIKAQLFFLFIFVCQMFVLYGSFIEPRMITVAHYETIINQQGRITPETQQRFFIPRRTPKKDTSDIRIALIADWHVGPYKQDDYVERVVQHLKKIQPDIILMPGDFIYTDPSETHYLAPLAQISQEIPIYVSLGNHDFNWREQHQQGNLDAIEYDLRYSQRHTEILESFGITVLRDERDTLTIQGNIIHIIGQDDWWATERDEVNTFIPTHTDTSLSILMQHNPDGAFFQDIPENIDLIVSGHTHGGQIRLPIIGPLWEIPTEIGNEVDQGWFTLQDSTQMLYVTHGIGETGPRSRLFAWPEVVVFDVAST